MSPLLLTNVIVITLIGLTLWYFFGQREDALTQVQGKRITIKVNGGYQPKRLKIALGEPVTLLFDRQDPSACLEEVVFPDFGIQQYLPLGKVTSIELTPTKTGKFAFHCGMSMYFGELVVT